jgi:peptide/nickel transport system ATP-binding protein
MRKGQSLGLVGESGCGASTASSMLVRLIDPTSGAIVVKGRDIGVIPVARFAAMCADGRS